MLVVLGVDRAITTCVRGILVYSVLSVVMYSPTMKLVASPRRPADEGVPQLRDTKQMRRLLYVWEKLKGTVIQNSQIITFDTEIEDKVSLTLYPKRSIFRFRGILLIGHGIFS